jgi:hypothetical protein
LPAIVTPEDRLPAAETCSGMASGSRRGKTPTKAMLSQLLRALDANAFEAALSRRIRSRLAAEPEQLSQDGKTLRAAGMAPCPAGIW